MTKEEFKNIIDYVNSVYNNKTIFKDDKTNDKIYNLHFSDLDYTKTFERVNHHVENNKFSPTIAEMVPGSKSKYKYWSSQWKIIIDGGYYKDLNAPGKYAADMITWNSLYELRNEGRLNREVDRFERYYNQYCNLENDQLLDLPYQENN